MKFIFRIQILMSVFFLFSNCFATYVVFKKNKNEILPIDNQEQYTKIIYPLLIKYTWPTSISYADEIVKEFSKPIHPIDEEAFLRDSLKKIDPTLDIAFIPDITYELMGLSMILERAISVAVQDVPGFSIEEYLPYGCFNIDTQLFDIVQNSSQLKDAYNFFKKVNLDSRLALAHWKLNNHIITQLSLAAFFSPAAFKKSTHKLINEMLAKNYPKGLELPLYFNRLIQNIPSSESPNLLSRIIDLEYQAHEKFASILYRGTTQFAGFVPAKERKAPRKSSLIDSMSRMGEDSKTLEKYKAIIDSYQKGAHKEWLSLYVEKTEPTTTSYGNSLFAGWICAKGACALSYFMENRIAYALLIDKRNYLTSIAQEFSKQQKNRPSLLNLASMFRIIPLDILLAIIAGGFLFHSRTIAYNIKDFESVKKSRDGEEYTTVIAKRGVYGLPNMTVDSMGYQLRIGNPLYFSYVFSSIIANPEITKILKLDGSTFEEQYNLNGPVQQQKIKMLYENQNENTKLYNSLSTLQDTIRKFEKRKKASK